MNQTLHDLGGIVLNGLPTFFLVLLLSLCVKYLYLNPLDKVLAERYRLTEGARKAAEESLRNADARIGDYEKALAEARGQIYREQSEFLQKLQTAQADEIQKMRAESDSQLRAAKDAINAEAAAVLGNLEAESDVLANQIAEAILGRGAAA
jgi:F0F1-type ATP synthase membrane subunit b/b'